MTGVLALPLLGCLDRDDRGIFVILAMTAEPCSPFTSPCGVGGNPNGYQFSVDGGAPHSIGPGGHGEMHDDFSDGTYEVTLVGLQAPCTDTGPRLVTFFPNVMRVSASFIVYCPASP